MRRFLLEQLLADEGTAAVPPPPAHFRDLFESKTKHDAQRVARTMKITQEGLFRLIHHADALGYKHADFHPEHREAALPSDDDWAAMRKERVGPHGPASRRFFNKVNAAFDQRKSMHIHAFVRGGEWHCFYFTWEDAVARDIGKARHWKHGDHLHYTSHLLTTRTLAEVVEELHGRHTNVKGEHIAFEVDRSR